MAADHSTGQYGGSGVLWGDGDFWQAWWKMKKAFFLGVIVALGFDWLILVPGMLFPNCAWRLTQGCTKLEMIAAYAQHAANLVEKDQ
jgi:hypothetical protein